MLTNIFIALESEAIEIINFYSQSKNWPYLEFNGLDNSAIASLLASLDLIDEAKDLEGENCIVAFEEGGPWVFLIPNRFMIAISTLISNDLNEVAEKWSKTKELSYMNAKATDLIPIIQSIQDFSIKAKNENKQLLLWMSL